MHNTVSLTQSVAIPYHITPEGRVRFCTVTSNKKQAWIFPKGIVDPGETPTETALKEALEEAGLHGVLDPDPLGSFMKEKWGHQVLFHVYLMRVTEIDDTWRESYKRRRRWRSPKKTLAKLSKPSLVPYLESAIERVEVSLRSGLSMSDFEAEPEQNPAGTDAFCGRATII